MGTPLPVVTCIFRGRACFVHRWRWITKSKCWYHTYESQIFFELICIYFDSWYAANHTRLFWYSIYYQLFTLAPFYNKIKWFLKHAKGQKPVPPFNYLSLCSSNCHGYAQVLKPTIGKFFSRFIRNYRTDPSYFPSQVSTEVGIIRRSIDEPPLYLR